MAIIKYISVIFILLASFLFGAEEERPSISTPTTLFRFVKDGFPEQYVLGTCHVKPIETFPETVRCKIQELMTQRCGLVTECRHDGEDSSKLLYVIPVPGDPTDPQVRKWNVLRTDMLTTLKIPGEMWGIFDINRIHEIYGSVALVCQNLSYGGGVDFQISSEWPKDLLYGRLDRDDDFSETQPTPTFEEAVNVIEKMWVREKKILEDGLFQQSVTAYVKHVIQISSFVAYNPLVPYYEGYEGFNPNRTIDSRNALWRTRLPELYAKGPALTTAGFGHLGGKTGLLEWARSEGYKIYQFWSDGTETEVDFDQTRLTKPNPETPHYLMDFAGLPAFFRIPDFPFGISSQDFTYSLDQVVKSSGGRVWSGHEHEFNDEAGNLKGKITFTGPYPLQTSDRDPIITYQYTIILKALSDGIFSGEVKAIEKDGLLNSLAPFSTFTLTPC